MLDGVRASKKGVLSGQLKCAERISYTGTAHSLAVIPAEKPTTKTPDKTFT